MCAISIHYRFPVTWKLTFECIQQTYHTVSLVTGLGAFKVVKSKGKAIPVTGLDMSWGFQEAETPRFQENLHMKVLSLSALRTGRLYLPRYSFLLEAESDPWAIVQAVRICQCKIQISNPRPSGL